MGHVSIKKVKKDVRENSSSVAVHLIHMTVNYFLLSYYSKRNLLHLDALCRVYMIHTFFRFYYRRLKWKSVREREEKREKMKLGQ